MLIFESIKKRANALNEEETRKISANEAIIFDSLKLSEKFALVRFAELAKAIDNKLSVMKLSVDVSYCKDDRLSLFYLISNDEKQSYIAKMYCTSANTAKCHYYIFAHARLLNACKEHETLKAFVTSDNKALDVDSASVVDVLKQLIALSK